MYKDTLACSLFIEYYNNKNDIEKSVPVVVSNFDLKKLNFRK